jgi:AcrR family transcriptional regulator
MGPVTQTIDGRRLRREQNRTAVLDALLELFRDGTYDPSSAEIAERAGLSPRSLFRYFDDIDDLHRAAIEANLALARPLVVIHTAPDAPTPAKIETVVDARMRLYRTIAPGARAGRILASRRPLVAHQLTQNRAFLRDQIASIFAAELARLAPPAAATALALADVLCSFESWDLLIDEQGLAVADARRALVTGLAAVFQPPGGDT